VISRLITFAVAGAENPIPSASNEVIKAAVVIPGDAIR
jgi:hypothetical protein